MSLNDLRETVATIRWQIKKEADKGSRDAEWLLNHLPEWKKSYVQSKTA